MGVVFYVPKKILWPICIRRFKLEISCDQNTNKIYDFTSAPSRRRKILFSRRESRELSFTVRLATHKRISAGIVARITLAVNSFTIRWSRTLSSRPSFPFLIAEIDGLSLRPFPESRASLAYHPSLGECISFSRTGIYQGVCEKIYEQPHREGNCGREISPAAKNTCDRFCTRDFTTLRGRGTSRAVNTF